MKYDEIELYKMIGPNLPARFLMIFVSESVYVCDYIDDI